MDEDVPRRFLRELAVVARKLRTLFDSRARESGMTYARARLLLHLKKCPQPTQGELAEALEIEQPTVVRLIDRMEKAGLATREVCGADRRVRRVSLTESAERQAQDVVDLTDRLCDDALQGIPADDLATASRVMRAVLDNIARAA